MPKPKFTIVAHMVVKNDDRFVWYAINSVLPYVDRFLITDTGSTDQTIPIIQSIKSPKINFSQNRIKHPSDLVLVRQKHLNENHGDWIWIVDGDEIYPSASSQEILKTLTSANSSLWGLVVPFYNWVGDIYHVQAESKGRYRFGSHLGHLNLRLMRNLPGLKVQGIYPTESYLYQNQPLQNYHSHLAFTQNNFFHAGNLQRSSLSKPALSRKIVYDLGLPLTQSLPEILTDPVAPILVNQTRSWTYALISTIKNSVQNHLDHQHFPKAKSLPKTLWSNPKYYQTAKVASLTTHPAITHLISQLNSSPLLEIGAGEGTKLSQFKPKTKVALDISSTGLKSALKKSLMAIQADAGVLPFINNSFASVISLFSLEHVTRPDRVIIEMIRVTKPGGLIGIVTPNFGAPNRASPCFKGNRIFKLIFGFLGDFIPNHTGKLHWHSVIPNPSFKDYQPDSDTTIEPYLKTLIDFLSHRGLTIVYSHSYWELPQTNEMFWQKIFKWLGSRQLYPFIHWGPHAYILAQKKL